jgi:hypothetical protein
VPRPSSCLHHGTTPWVRRRVRPEPVR